MRSLVPICAWYIAMLFSAQHLHNAPVDSQVQNCSAAPGLVDGKCYSRCANNQLLKQFSICCGLCRKTDGGHSRGDGESAVLKKTEEPCNQSARQILGSQGPLVAGSLRTENWNRKAKSKKKQSAKDEVEWIDPRSHSEESEDEGSREKVNESEDHGGGKGRKRGGKGRGKKKDSAKGEIEWIGSEPSSKESEDESSREFSEDSDESEEQRGGKGKGSDSSEYDVEWPDAVSVSEESEDESSREKLEDYDRKKGRKRGRKKEKGEKGREKDVLENEEKESDEEEESVDLERVKKGGRRKGRGKKGGRRKGRGKKGGKRKGRGKRGRGKEGRKKGNLVAINNETDDGYETSSEKENSVQENDKTEDGDKESSDESKLEEMKRPEDNDNYRRKFVLWRQSRRAQYDCKCPIYLEEWEACPSNSACTTKCTMKPICPTPDPCATKQ